MDWRVKAAEGVSSTARAAIDKTVFPRCILSSVAGAIGDLDQETVRG